MTNAKSNFLCALGFFSWMPFMFPGISLAFDGLGFLPESQWRGTPPYWHTQPPVTYYRITTGGMVLLLFLGVILICLIAATVYLLVIYKKRMDDLEQNYSRFDDSLKDLYRKQKEDLDNVLQHVYELRKRTESREPSAPIRDTDTHVGRRGFKDGEEGT